MESGAKLMGDSFKKRFLNGEIVENSSNTTRTLR